MAGIKDVAKKAGVGVGTVSRMLNDSGYVADDTRKKRVRDIGNKYSNNSRSFVVKISGQLIWSII